MNDFKKSLSVVELEERHEMSTLALEDYAAENIVRCRDRCAKAAEE